MKKFFFLFIFSVNCSSISKRLCWCDMFDRTWPKPMERGSWKSPAKGVLIFIWWGAAKGASPVPALGIEPGARRGEMPFFEVFQKKRSDGDELAAVA